MYLEYAHREVNGPLYKFVWHAKISGPNLSKAPLTLFYVALFNIVKTVL